MRVTTINADRGLNDFSAVPAEHLEHRFAVEKSILDDSFDSLDQLSETQSINYLYDRKTKSYYLLETRTDSRGSSRTQDTDTRR